MSWRKWSCCLMAMGCFLVWGGLSPLWAGEMDVLHLLNLLQKKGVITQEEANDLMNEVRSNTKNEKEESSKAIQEDIKKEAAKGNLVPSALKGFSFGSTIFSEWNNKSIKNGANTNDFNLNRAYLTLKYKFNPWMDVRLTTDVFTSKDVNDKGNGLEVRMKYAYVNLNLFGTNTELGLVHTPSDDYESAIWPFRVQEKHYLDYHGIQASADLGIANRGTFGGNMDSEYLNNVSKAYVGKWGGYMVGVYNGAGYDNTEANTDKAVSGLIYVRPAPMVPFLKGLQLAYYGNYGKSNANFAAPGDIGAYPDWQANIGTISLQHEMFGVLAQYYWGKGTKASTEQNNRSGYLAEGYLKIPGVKKLRLFGKYDYYDSNTDKSNDGVTTYVAGLSYDVTNAFMPFVAWEHLSNEAPTGDFDKFQVGFQLNF